MKLNRPSVPVNVSRQLRQDAGFGCCACGHPFIQYHHIIPWAEDEHFRSQDMMVLCGNCHYLCTVGAITENEQRTYKARPRNIIDNQVRGQLYVNKRELVVNLAGGQAVETPKLLTLSGEPVLSARLDPEHGRVLISAQIHGKDGQIIGQLHDNEWSMAPKLVWDFDARPLYATIRLKAQQIAFSIDVRNDEINLNGKWFHKGTRIEFSPSGAQIGTTRIQSMNTYSCGGFISIG
jgi:ferredoxin